MDAEQAIRFLAHEARRCRDRDSHEALCLLTPSVMNVLHLMPMDYGEAVAFECELRAELRERSKVMTGADFPN